MKTYMMRNAQWASLHSSMGMGQGPWTFGDPQVEKVMLPRHDYTIACSPTSTARRSASN